MEDWSPLIPDLHALISLGGQMNRNPFVCFVLGVVCCAVTLGAVQFVSAASNSTIKACANKTTGTMRYLAKGSCKKTETLLSWSQQGPQGLPGSQGPSGVAGERGAAGSNGQNLFAVDAAGKTLGPVRGASGIEIIVEIDGRLWAAHPTRQLFWSQGGSASFWQDISCTQPFISLGLEEVPNPQLVSIDFGTDDVYQSTDKAYQTTGSAMTFSGRSVYYSSNGVCTSASASQKTNWDMSYKLYFPTEVTKPTYVAPLSIVSR
jgi:hypothetical protein